MSAHPRSSLELIVPRILVVDDSPVTLGFAQAILQAQWDVVPACTGDEALSVLANDPTIAVVVSDLQMPGLMSGPKLLERVHQIRPDVVIVAMTSDDSPSTILEAINRGHVFRYIVKPVSRDNLTTAALAAIEQFRIVTADRRLLESKVQEISQQLLQAERLATLGGLANGVGHELNNVAATLSFLADEMSEMHAAGQAPDAELVQQLSLVKDHVATHGKFLLHLGKPRGDSVERQNLVEVTRDAIQLLRGVRRVQAVKLETDFCADAEKTSILANRTRLEQVITNLVVNAADAASSAKTRFVNVRVQVGCEPGMAVLRVTDDASGIAPEHLARIFEPYFSTKGPDHGTGLGLAVVRQIVEAFGGKISVHSQLGVGTQFTIRWPLADSPAAKRPSSAVALVAG